MQNCAQWLSKTKLYDLIWSALKKLVRLARYVWLRKFLQVKLCRNSPLKMFEHVKLVSPLKKCLSRPKLSHLPLGMFLKVSHPVAGIRAVRTRKPIDTVYILETSSNILYRVKDHIYMYLAINEPQSTSFKLLKSTSKYLKVTQFT